MRSRLSRSRSSARPSSRKKASSSRGADVPSPPPRPTPATAEEYPPPRETRPVEDRPPRRNRNKPVVVSPRKKAPKAPIDSPLRHEGPTKQQRSSAAGASRANQKSTTSRSRSRSSSSRRDAVAGNNNSLSGFLENFLHDKQNDDDDDDDSDSGSESCDYSDDDYTSTSSAGSQNSAGRGTTVRRTDLVGMVGNALASVSMDNASDDDGSSSSSSSDEDEDEDKGKEQANKLFGLASNDATLTEIDIDCDTIETQMAKDIAKLLPNNSRLQKLCLTCTSKEQMGHQRNFHIVMAGLEKNSSVTDIQIKGADLNREAASWLGSAISRNQPRRRVCLKECKLVDSGLAVLFLGMQHNRQIQELVILSCHLTRCETDIVAASLPLLRLKSLSLVDTNLTVDGLRFLCDNIEKAPDLTKLDLSRNVLDVQGIKFLVKSLKSPQQRVANLALTSCRLDGHCLNELAKGLLHNSTLVSINLSQNAFGDPGATCLKDLLEANKRIKELKLERCGIGSKKLKAIANGLRYNNSILSSLFGLSETTSLAILETVDSIEEKLENPFESGTAAAARVGPRR